MIDWNINKSIKKSIKMLKDAITWISTLLKEPSKMSKKVKS